MINPSANAWIEKFFQEQITHATTNFIADDYYSNLRDSGFIYGHIVSIPSFFPIPTEGWLKVEIYKVALLNNMFQMYVLSKQKLDPIDFVNQAVTFYNQMNPQESNLLYKILPKNSPFLSLEKIIEERIRTNENGISKNFTHLVTNALLFIDILAFKYYLHNEAIPEKYIKKIEETIMSIVTLALKTKSNKSQHDDLLIKLFEASVRYSKFSNINYDNLGALQLDYFTDELEKKYLLDVADLTLWSDGVVNNNEKHFLYKLAEIMILSDEIVEESIFKTDHFITTFKSEIPYFNATSPVKNFYTQTTKSVELLISRNKKRLLKELYESKELMVLLAASTRRDLDEIEKKKVKIQLLDICKSIPSLTIFLLPGGSLLLPILIKFIPKLLPSSFNENLEE